MADNPKLGCAYEIGNRTVCLTYVQIVAGSATRASKRQITIAKRYEAECKRVHEASGIHAADKREMDACKALTMSGVMIKAQALAAWSNVPLCGVHIMEAREWGPKFGASIIRLSEGGAA